MTYEEYWALGDLDGLRVEWVDGEAIVYTGALTRHVRMSGSSYSLRSGFVRVLDLGEMFASNLAWISQVALRCGRFVMEIVSEDGVTRDRRDKRCDYQQAGVPNFVAADSREGRHGFEFLRLDAGGDRQDVVPDAQARDHSKVLPGFWFDPRWFWQDPLPDIDEILLRIAGDAYIERLLAMQRAIRQEPDEEDDPPRS